MIRINLSPERKIFRIGGKKYESHEIPIRGYVMGIIFGLAPILFFDHFIFPGAIQEKRLELSRLNQQKADLQSKSAVAARNAEELRKFIAQREEFNKKLQVLGRVVSFRKNPMPVMMDVNEVIPGNVWLTAVDYKKGKLTLRGRAMSLNGVNDFLKKLSKVENLANVVLINSQRQQETQEFEMKMVYLEDGRG